LFLSWYSCNVSFSCHDSYITAISWPEQVTLQLYHDKNKLHYSYIMTRTSYTAVISWPEQVTLQLYHDMNKLHYSYIMTRTSYITAISWQEQVTLQLYHDKNKLHYSYIMTRTSYSNLFLLWYNCNVSCSYHDLAVMYLVLVMI
jgi:lipoate-protein ligase A